MADPPPYFNAGNDTSVGSDRESGTGTPRWVKVFAIITIVVVLLFIGMLVAGGGRHGPSRHRVSDGGQIQFADVAEVGALPEGGH